MNYFPNGDEEIELIKFIAKYQYLNLNDVPYFFKSKRYYRDRIRHLKEKKYIRKTGSNFVLDELGIEYVKLFNLEYNPINRNGKYHERLLSLSHIGAFYIKSKTLKFIPSFSIKDKKIYTTTGRRYIGIFDINGIEYLTYLITEEHDHKYITSIMYDIQKEQKYKNIIILVDDINRINFNEFTFGINQVIILEDTRENKEKLQFLNSVNWSNIINRYYKNRVNLSEYGFCDYTDNKFKFISTFYFVDTEKINRINYFLRENKHKNMDIICDVQTEEEIIKKIPNANYIIVDLAKFIDKERNYYG